MFPVAPIFQQQLFAGLQAAQQGFFNESQGNLPLAINCYQQAINYLSQSMVGAGQASVSVPDHVYHTYGQIHFCAARAKAAVGDVVGAQQHLMEATTAFSTAANLNPMAPHHRLALGDMLLLMGNLPEAGCAFSAVLQLSPGHPYALQRLAAIRYVSGGQTGMPVFRASSGDNSSGPGMKKIQDTIKVATGAIGLLEKIHKLFEGASTSGDAAMGGGTMQGFDPWSGMMMSADPNLVGGWSGFDNSGF
jgi:tetratricopeptide (TPR) repeat protein